MPRTNRGGQRQGQPGKTYSNRTDLSTGARKALTQTGPSPQYGEGVKREASLAAVPLSPPAAPVTPPSGAAAGGGFPMPGSLGPIDAPTNRPDEPVTTGLPTGPGAGPEILAQREDPDLASMLKYLPALELIANLPTATVATRNFVRRLRGAGPVPQPPPTFTD